MSVQATSVRDQTIHRIVDGKMGFNGIDQIISALSQGVIQAMERDRQMIASETQKITVVSIISKHLKPKMVEAYHATLFPIYQTACEGLSDENLKSILQCVTAGIGQKITMSGPLILKVTGQECIAKETNPSYSQFELNLSQELPKHMKRISDEMMALGGNLIGQQTEAFAEINTILLVHE